MTATYTSNRSTTTPAVDLAIGAIPKPASDTLTLSDALIESVVRLADDAGHPTAAHSAYGGRKGIVTGAFGVIGGPAVWLVESAAAHPRLEFVACSSEAEAGFACCEASLASGNRIHLMITTTGPGIVAGLWPLAAAKSEGANVLLLSARTPPQSSGSWDVQDTGTYHPYHQLGAHVIFDLNVALEDVRELPRLVLRLKALFSRPQGAVVHISVPANLLALPCPQIPDPRVLEIARPGPSAAALARTLQWLRGAPFAVCVGFGARHHAAAVERFLERTNAYAFTTPRGNGITRRSHGIVGNGARGDVPAVLRELGIRTLVVLGSRMGPASGGGDGGLLAPRTRVVHVDVDPLVPGLAFSGTFATPDAPAIAPIDTYAVTSDIGELLSALEPHELPRQLQPVHLEDLS